jgi:hypothetical protein
MNFKEFYLTEAVYKEVYSGRTVNNPEITLDYVGKGMDQQGPGLYFTNDPEEAKFYGKYVVVANLTLNKVLTDSKKPILREVQFLINNAPNKEDKLSDFGETEREAMKEATESYMDNDSMKDSYLTICNDFYRGSSAKYFCINMAKLGYDGIVSKFSSTSTHYIMYNTKKIQLIAFGER